MLNIIKNSNSLSGQLCKKAKYFLIAILLTSCQHIAPEKKSDFSVATQSIKEIENEQLALQKQSEISNQQLLDSLMPPVSTSVEIIEDRFDVSVKNINLRSFLLGLVESTIYNMVVSPEVDLKISLQLKNVTVSEVLNAVEKIYPVMIEKENNLFFVSSAESMTAVYPVNYLNLTRSGKSRTSISGQTMAASKSGGNNQSDNSNNNSSSSGNNVSALNSSEVTTESDSDFWKELQRSLELIIVGEEKANVVVSPQAGIVVVKALPATQRLIQQYLGVTQNNLNRQVILEAKIIEVSLADGFQAGIDWSKVNSVNGNPFSYGQKGQTLTTQNVDNPMNGIFSMIYKGTSFNAAIELLESQGDVQVLSSPRISTVNNQKAVIKVGTDEFFVTDVSTTTVTGTSTATTPDVTLTPFFSGISLDVTPQINKSGDIVLHIHPIVSEVEDQQKTITLGTDDFTLPLALTTVRESDSIVRTKNQQVIVIGGLMQNKVKNRVNSTPFLGDIPLIGGLFRQTREAVVKSELVILLKANLVDGNYNQKQIQQIKNRINQL